MSWYSYGSNKAVFEDRCVMCKKTIRTEPVEQKDMYSYVQNRTFIQDAFPYLTKADREFVISQTCGTCFDELFKKEE